MASLAACGGSASHGQELPAPVDPAEGSLAELTPELISNGYDCGSLDAAHAYAVADDVAMVDRWVLTDEPIEVVLDVNESELKPNQLILRGSVTLLERDPNVGHTDFGIPERTTVDAAAAEIGPLNIDDDLASILPQLPVDLGVLIGIAVTDDERELRWVPVAYIVGADEELVRLFTCGDQAYWPTRLREQLSSYEGTTLDLITGNDSAAIERLEHPDTADGSLSGVGG